MPPDHPREKTCKKCDQGKPLDAFHASVGAKDGRRGECKACAREIRRQNYLKNRDAYIKRAQQWKIDNRDRYLEGQRRRRELRGEAQIRVERDQYLQRTYGLRVEDFEFLVVAQGGRCAICGKQDEDRLHVDHDHGSGRVRGLLCGSCNRAMGLFHEDPARFEAAGAYLRRPQLPLGSGDKQRRPTRKVRRQGPLGPSRSERLS